MLAFVVSGCVLSTEKDFIVAILDFLRVIVTSYFLLVFISSEVTVYSTGFVTEALKSWTTLELGSTVAPSETSISGAIEARETDFSTSAVIFRVS